ncbi:ABC-type transport auxiliary lipoprotein family protein [Paraburkholderia sp. RL17-373-BIF-A]|uniref:ABC-type transport auxiliary lipoprotein family protein n=1 Tax=Paraburkholderia sp. RL17-373-BIF-A TaxID=3031629 RepID=UPI0038B6D4B7
MNLPGTALRLILCGALAACSALLPARTPDVYGLPMAQHVDNTSSASTAADGAPVTPAAGTPAAAPMLLRIRTVAIGATLAGNRIVVMPTPDTIEANRGARWSDPAPTMVRTRPVEAFANDDRFIAVADDEGTLRAPLELDAQLRAFQTEYRDGKPVVHVGLDVRLVDPGTHSVIATHRFDVEAFPAAADAGSVVRSFGYATDALSRRLAGWVACIATHCG